MDTIHTPSTPWNEVKRHARLWRRCLALAIVREMQFRANFSSIILVGLAQIVLGMVPILILFEHTTEVDGWTRADPAITRELAQLGRSGVPVYALYRAPGQAPQVLSEILTVAQVQAAQTPFMITVDGKIQAVVQDIFSNQRTRDQIALLKMLALGTQEIEAGNLTDHDAFFAELEAEESGRADGVEADCKGR